MIDRRIFFARGVGGLAGVMLGKLLRKPEKDAQSITEGHCPLCERACQKPTTEESDALLRAWIKERNDMTMPHGGYFIGPPLSE